MREEDWSERSLSGLALRAPGHCATVPLGLWATGPPGHRAIAPPGHWATDASRMSELHVSCFPPGLDWDTAGLPVVKRLAELRDAARASKENAVKSGHNAQTRTFIFDVGCPTLVDSGASNNTSLEELVCSVFTDAFKKGFRLGDQSWLVRNLQWLRDESIGGIRADTAVKVVAPCDVDL